MNETEKQIRAAVVAVLATGVVLRAPLGHLQSRQHSDVGAADHHDDSAHEMADGPEREPQRYRLNTTITVPAGELKVTTQSSPAGAA
jgi:hypothetical protein